MKSFPFEFVFNCYYILEFLPIQMSISIHKSTLVHVHAITRTCFYIEHPLYTFLSAIYAFQWIYFYWLTFSWWTSQVFPYSSSLSFPFLFITLIDPFLYFYCPYMHIISHAHALGNTYTILYPYSFISTSTIFVTMYASNYLTMYLSNYVSI